MISTIPNIDQQTAAFAISRVSRSTGLTPEDIVGPSRKNRAVFARHLAMSLVREATKMTLIEIGEIFGRRDHATVIYAVLKTTDRIQQSTRLATFYRRALADIRIHQSKNQ